MATHPALSGPLFVRDGDCFAPTDRSRGPWSPDALHGSPVAALLAFCVEERAQASSLRLSRLTVDLCRPVPFGSLTVEIEPLREGRRLALYRITISESGQALTHASALCLQREAALGSTGSEYGDGTPPFPAPDPDYRLDRRGNRWVSYPGTLEMRNVREPGGGEPPLTWIRSDAPVVAGEEPTPTTRAAAIADFVSPFANMQPGRSGYVNADITLYLHREPIGDWHWLGVQSRGAADGVATAQAVLGDRGGAYGSCSAASLINP